MISNSWEEESRRAKKKPQNHSLFLTASWCAPIVDRQDECHVMNCNTHGREDHEIQIWELPTQHRGLSTLAPQSASQRANACLQRYQLITLKVMENTHTHTHSLSPVPFRLVSNAPSPKLKSYLTVRTVSTCLSEPYIPLNQELDKSPKPGCHGTHCFPELSNYS